MDASANHLRIIENQSIAGAQQRRQLGEPAMIGLYTIEHQQTAGTARLQSGLGNEFFGKVEGEIAAFQWRLY